MRPLAAVALAFLPLALAAPADAPPSVRVVDADAWLLAALGGVDARAEACDADGTVEALTMAARRPDGRVLRAAAAPGAPCGSVVLRVVPGAPGVHPLHAMATDDAGAAARDAGRLDVQVLPFDPTGPGAPPLHEVPAASVGLFVRVDARLAPDGALRAYRVSSENGVHASTWTTVVPSPSDRLVHLTWDRAVAFAWLVVDNEEL